MDAQSRLDAVVAEFYEIGAEPGAWEQPLALLSEVVGAVGCDLHFLRDAAPLFSVISGTPPEVLDEYDERFLHREPRSQFLASAHEGALTTDAQLVTLDEMRAIDYYADFLNRAGMGHCIAGLPVCREGNSVYLGVHLPRSMGAPEQQALKMIRYVLPHIGRVARTQLLLLDADLRNALYTEALDQLAAGVVILDQHLKPLFANRAAERMLGESSVVTVVGGRFGAVASGDSGLLRKLIVSAVGKVDGCGGSAILGSHAASRLSVTVTPAADHLRATTGAAALVFLTVLEPAQSGDAYSGLGQLFGLTRAESAIAVRLAHGQAVRTLADELGITYETARTTLKRVFAKTGVRRQAELVTLIHNALPPIRRK